MISLSNLGMRFGAQVLFEGATWMLQPGAHYGLVGANGTGKSTLLRLMAGELKPESGTLSRPNDLSLGTLGQDHFRYDGQKPIDVAISGNPRLFDALQEKEALLARLESTGPAVEREGHRLAELEAVIADCGGYEAEARAGALLTGLGLEERRHRRPMKELSGGYRLRVLLARTLFAEPELLLLDEPSNHLDIDSIRWLEGHLRAFPGNFVVVSHDRHFLNAVCDHIADVDYGELRLYPGNYDAFITAKELAVQQKDTEIARAEEKIAEMQKFIDRFRAKATKARQAQSRKKQVERIEMPEIKRSSRRFPAFAFTQRRPSGREALTVEGVGKAYGEQRVLDGIGFTLARGEKLAVVGPNGIGKSTLLKIVNGVLAPDSGKVVPGYEVQQGYFAQDHHEVLRGRTSVYEWLHATAPGESVGTIRGLLGKVRFSGDEADKAVGDLSGGESARLLLAGLMLRCDNLLVLDEPTNHLDLEGREALMNALRQYEGTLIFVSHDRHFVSSVGQRILVLSHKGVEDVHGSYDEYLALQGEDFLEPGRIAGQKETGQRDRQPAGDDYRQRKERKRATAKLKRRVERMEHEVEKLEGELAAWETRFAEADYYRDASSEQIRRDRQAQQGIQARLKETLAEWEKAASDLQQGQEAS